MRFVTSEKESRRDEETPEYKLGLRNFKKGNE